MADMIHYLVRAAFAAASGYPIDISDKGKLFLDKLRAAKEGAEIYNAEYKEAGDWLNRDFENAARGLEDRYRKQGVSLYGITKSLSYLTSVNTIVRDYEKWLKKPEPYSFRAEDAVTPQMIDAAKEMLALVTSWQGIMELRKAVKPNVKMGRKPSGEGKPRYTPPPASHASLAQVNKILRELVESKRAELEKMAFRFLWAKIERFFKTHGSESPWRFYKMDPTMPGLIEKVVKKRTGKWGGEETDWKTAEIGDHAKAIVEKEAKESAESVVQNYVSKNMLKLTRLVGEKGGEGAQLADVKDLGMQVRQGTFLGWMQFTFSDGTGFHVLNQMVVKPTKYGRLFAQYPTTFHKVIFPDGTQRAKLSEQEMNEEWVR